MTAFDRRTILRAGLLGATCLLSPAMLARAQTLSLSDIGRTMNANQEVTIYTAREIITLDLDFPSANAVAVLNNRILAVGSLENVQALVGTQPYQIDTSFADKVIVPGFIAQHDHPMLAALTMSSEILSIEDWVLPSGTVPAVTDKQDFLARLTLAESRLEDPDEPLLTWGYHPYFFGPLTRVDLDSVSTTRPILAWARSCHAFVLNTAALERGGITQDMVAAWTEAERAQSNFAEGHFWEQGCFAVLGGISSMVARPDKFRAGLELTREYLHAKGVTFGNEPGGILSKPVQDFVNSVFSSPSMPFRWSFTPDGKTLASTYADAADVLAETEGLADWYGGMTSLAQGSIKLFADGAIYSQLMQVRDPYTDGHEGEWMTDQAVFDRAFQLYWDAGYQIHIHVNGDAGLDMVLDTLETNLSRNPRLDHRTTIVHFAVSAPDQTRRIQDLGAIVSANPYYVTALADKYGDVGLGPERSDNMVRLGEVERSGISFSLHSDMPMAPADPLFLMWCAVNRITSSGRMVAEDQRVSREGALRGVTIEAAYSHRLENEMGSIESGKLANFTILDDNPLTVDEIAIKDIGVWGTVMEGRKLPVGYLDTQAASLEHIHAPDDEAGFAVAVVEHAVRNRHSHG